MRRFKLFMTLFITMAVILSVGCTSSAPSPSAPTVNYQDQEFVALFTESATELTQLLSNAVASAQDNRGDELVIDGVALKSASYVYIAEIETLTVSPAFESAKSNYIKALEELSDAGLNYANCGEYMVNSDYATAAEYLTKAAAHVKSATEYIEKVKDSLP